MVALKKFCPRWLEFPRVEKGGMQAHSQIPSLLANKMLDNTSQCPPLVRLDFLWLSPYEGGVDKLILITDFTTQHTKGGIEEEGGGEYMPQRESWLYQPFFTF